VSAGGGEAAELEAKAPGEFSAAEFAVTVLGSGAAALALAATAAEAGAPTVLANRPGARLDRVAAAGCVRLTTPDGVSRHVPLTATSDVLPAVARADLLIVAVGSAVQAEVLTAVAPALRADQVVLLVPGHTGGAWCVRAAFLAAGQPVPTLAEAPLPFVCRDADGGARILQYKNCVAVGAADAATARRAHRAASAVGFPVTSVVSLLESGLRNTTMVVQPALLLANAARVDRGESFRIYRDGATLAVGRLIAAVDDERLRVASAYGLQVPGVCEWLRETYGASGQTPDELIRAVPGYADIMAPSSVRHRFLDEHVRTGMVPLRALAGVVGIDTPVSAALIELAGVVTGADLLKEGRGLGSMVPQSADSYASSADTRRVLQPEVFACPTP
jgi:opine dehydrogenase